MRVVSRMLLIVAVLAASGCVMPGAPISAYGRQLSVHDVTERAQGELLAANADTIWLQQQGGVRWLTLTERDVVRVRQHRYGMGSTMRWLLVAGAATAGALLVACNSYESSSDGTGDTRGCLVVVPAVLASAVLGGMVFGSLNEHSTVHRLTRADSARIRGFSRYPQGLPDALRSPLDSATPGLQLGKPR